MKSEVGSQKSEIGSPKSEAESRKSGLRPLTSELRPLSSKKQAYACFPYIGLKYTFPPMLYPDAVPADLNDK